MVAQGLRCELQSYNHRTQYVWKIVPDGSVRGGAELVSPVLRGDDGFGQLAAAGRALATAGCKVNRTTGLHVHHDVRDLDVASFRRLVHNWHDSQDAIDGLVARSRRNQRGTYDLDGYRNFCMRLDTYDLARVDTLSSMDRHVAARHLSGDLNAAWESGQEVTGYPPYMPSFDEFVLDLENVEAAR